MNVTSITVPLTQTPAQPSGLCVPRLQSVEWLANALKVKKKAVYDIIAAKQLPDECVFRVGNRIRIREQQALEWLNARPITPLEGAYCDARR